MKTTREKISLVFLLLIVVIIIVAGIIVALSLRNDNNADKFKEDQVINLLFVLNDGENHALATDVFIYYPVSKKGAIFDILGNTGAIYQSLTASSGRKGRVDRIDAVYTECGMEKYRAEIEKLTGLSIPFSLDISKENLGLLTDLLGGMKVFIPSPVDAQGSEGERWLLPSGAVTLDGDKIQTYIQYILPEESEDDKEDRRQNVIVALITAIKDNRSIIINKKNFPIFASKIGTNADSDELYKILDEISNVDNERLNPQTITGTTQIVENKKLLFPSNGGQLLKDIMKMTTNFLVSSNTVMPSRVYVVEVKNGTAINKLASKTGVNLQSAGYDVLSVSDVDAKEVNTYDKTIIINHIGNKEVAKELGDFIHCTNIVEEKVQPDTETMISAADVDFTIILGNDFDKDLLYVRNNE